MEILNILTVYNDIKFLQIKKKWCEKNGLELYVIDNYSNDGTWEWLQENNIRSHRVNTDGAFDLRILHKAITDTIHLVKPDWFIYNGADLFPMTKVSLNFEIAKADIERYNAISMPWVMMYNTGEVMNEFNPFNTYFYFKQQRGVAMIVKYAEDFYIDGDTIKFAGKRELEVDGVMINYGHTKSVEERDETFRRRQLAWQRGMTPAWGTHYKEAKEKNWIWDKGELKDIRESEYAWAVEKLQRL